MDIIGYEAKCQSCGWVHSSGKRPTEIKDMPSKCDKCEGSMAMMPIFKGEEKSRNYEIWINCKETGITVTGGVSLTDESLKNLSREEMNDKVVKLILEEFARMISKEENVNKMVGGV